MVHTWRLGSVSGNDVCSFGQRVEYLYGHSPLQLSRSVRCGAGRPRVLNLEGKGDETGQEKQSSNAHEARFVPRLALSSSSSRFRQLTGWLSLLKCIVITVHWQTVVIITEPSWQGSGQRLCGHICSSRTDSALRAELYLRRSHREQPPPSILCSCPVVLWCQPHTELSQTGWLHLTGTAIISSSTTLDDNLFLFPPPPVPTVSCQSSLCLSPSWRRTSLGPELGSDSTKIDKSRVDSRRTWRSTGLSFDSHASMASISAMRYTVAPLWFTSGMACSPVA